MWEGNGKEILNIFGVGGKWEGNNKFFWRGKEKNYEKIGKSVRIFKKKIPKNG